MADPIDVVVGGRLRTMRERRRMSQTALADAIGVSFQQVQKYERGANRISASALVRASTALDIPPAWFFEDMGSDAPAPDTSLLAGLSRESAGLITILAKLLRAQGG